MPFAWEHAAPLLSGNCRFGTIEQQCPSEHLSRESEYVDRELLGIEFQSVVFDHRGTTYLSNS
ncbi:hypothetical protein N7534_011907 [Penicillium rubens]|nr:hypothetical protein N7534_011907 [Penicillium rubens]